MVRVFPIFAPCFAVGSEFRFRLPRPQRFRQVVQMASSVQILMIDVLSPSRALQLLHRKLVPSLHWLWKHSHA
jgi:hypothetical protein